MTRNSVWDLRENDSITGTYMGAQFTGTVRKIEAHTINLEICRVYVTLDEAILVYGTERRGLCLELNSSGHEYSLTGYRSYWVDL